MFIRKDCLSAGVKGTKDGAKMAATEKSDRDDLPLRFLIVEDDPDYAQNLELMIKAVCPANRGIVMTARADKAVEILRSSSFDVCFLDYYLEDETTGFDVLRGLKDKKLLTTFVFLTNNTGRSTAFEAL